MSPKKTVQQRAKELQSLLATPAGRQELHELKARYVQASDRLKPGKGRSSLTFWSTRGTRA
jgi:hypothetical protein